MEELNPYAAPQAALFRGGTRAMQMRQTFLRTERHVKAFGVLVAVLSLMAILEKLMRARILSELFEVTIIPWPYIAFGSPMCAAGVGLYFTKRWAGRLAMVLGIVLIVISLNQLPWGLLTLGFQAVALVFLSSTRVKCVLSPEYQKVILRTPMLRSRPAEWIVPVVALIVLVMLVPAVLFAMR